MEEGSIVTSWQIIFDELDLLSHEYGIVWLICMYY